MPSRTLQAARAALAAADAEADASAVDALALAFCAVAGRGMERMALDPSEAAAILETVLRQMLKGVLDGACAEVSAPRAKSAA